jgi:3-oxoacyl-[acyl-carrier protein] reductase
MDLQLVGQVAFVTGGARGIGAGIVRALVAEGAHVAIWDRDIDAASDLAREMSQQGGTALAIGGDVTSADEVKEAIHTITKELGAIRIAINNAGFSLDAPITQMTDERWDQVYEVCLKATFVVCRAVAPAMIEQGYGRIINISSRTHDGEVNKSNYAAAKAGVIGLTRSLALELGKHAITANCVAPGLIRTERVLLNPFYLDIDERARAATPIQRPGDVSDVADAVLYLASPRTGFVSGEVLHVAGGRR